MEPARRALCDFGAAAHEFKPDFPNLRGDTGDFILDLSGALSEFLSCDDNIEREFEESKWSMKRTNPS